MADAIRFRYRRDDWLHGIYIYIRSFVIFIDSSPSDGRIPPTDVFDYDRFETIRRHANSRQTDFPAGAMNFSDRGGEGKERRSGYFYPLRTNLSRNYALTEIVTRDKARTSGQSQFTARVRSSRSGPMWCCVNVVEFSGGEERKKSKRVCMCMCVEPGEISFSV